MDLFADKVYNKELGRQEVFFDRTWNSLIDLYSYGHDIETSWLMDRGLEVLDDENILRRSHRSQQRLQKIFITELLWIIL